ncbi:polyprenol phosphomannose-dependent alpha 1,6 mannosyltransferase MptB [Jatrophihabitans sp.]|uniref:polyprenol phosphomannose-dependent alpha 1,6 mannosyltransferase MptB n=1 Tax=Jatrophihabitans sp. TaxID=1932789 RepID=UPI0030C75C16|nr:Alpha,6-mannosyltransferase [Jatrophihabitans sp.]
MNDLAEKALRGALTVSRFVVRRPVAPLGLLGLAAAALTVVAGGRIGASADALPLTRWLDLLAPAGYRLTDAGPAALMVGGIVGLLLLWSVALQLARHDRISERQTWTLAALWGLPFVVGPPLLSTDVYSSVAHGLLARAGFDPYRHPPSALLHHPQIVAAIDPGLRSTASTGGPLSTLTEHLAVAVAGGRPLPAVLVLRALAVVCAVIIGVLAAELAGPRRAAAVALTTLNPAVLLYVVSGAHLDGLLVALLLGSLVTAGQRRWALAVLLACLAAGVKPVGIVAVPALIAAHAIGQRRRISWRIAGRDTLIAAATLAASSLVVTDGLGWVRNVNASTREHTLFAPASLVSDLIAPVVSGASYDDLAIGGRIAALLAAVTAVSYLLLTVLERPLERTLGYALLWIGLLSPVLYPWYLLWGLLCLAPATRGAQREWLIGLSAAAAVLAPVGFTQRTGQVVTAVLLAVIACVLLSRHLIRRRYRELVSAVG